MQTKIIGALLFIGQMTWAQNKESVADFKKAEIRISTTVYLKKSDTPYVSFEHKDSAKAGLRIASNEGILIIEEKKDFEIPDKITIGYVNLDELHASGAATVKTSEPLSADKFTLQVSGASKVKLELALSELSTSISGAASCILSGKATSMTAIVSGASSLKAEELLTEKVQINASGASTARVNVSTSLTGIVSGASSLKFVGEPKETQINQSGASSVKRIDANGSSGNISGEVTTPTSGNGKDSTRKYTINGRYEIIVHENFHDTTTHRYKRRNDGRIRKQNWTGIDLFENGLLTPNNSISMDSANDYMSLNYGVRNLGWSLNIFEKDFRFAKGRMQFVTGLGFTWNYYNLKNKTNLNADSSYTSTYAYNPAAEYRKNKLRESWITIPLLLELNTSRRDSRNFHIAAGVIGGLKLGSSTKQIFTINDHTYETIRKDDYNLFPFKLDATVRIGYGDFTLFGTYSLTPLFENKKGPELYAFSVGLRICPFN